ncbi:MAG TPA: GPW/gp25 family protein [Acidimicrobiales bacterium]|nr:GPW/gp25 family protein [Acidimicrobiales bacterium]
MSLSSRDEIIGIGWGFPMYFNAAGGVGLSSQGRKLEESIRLILSTAVGERPMRPRFGCRIHDHVFGVINDETINSMSLAVKESLKMWEPRILVKDVTVTQDPDEQSLVWIDVSYEPKDTNDRRNLVFPFYSIPVEEAAE